MRAYGRDDGHQLDREGQGFPIGQYRASVLGVHGINGIRRNLFSASCRVREAVGGSNPTLTARIKLIVTENTQAQRAIACKLRPS